MWSGLQCGSSNVTALVLPYIKVWSGSFQYSRSDDQTFVGNLLLWDTKWCCSSRISNIRLTLRWQHVVQMFSAPLSLKIKYQTTSCRSSVPLQVPASRLISQTPTLPYLLCQHSVYTITVTPDKFLVDLHQSINISHLSSFILLTDCHRSAGRERERERWGSMRRNRRSGGEGARTRCGACSQQPPSHLPQPDESVRHRVSSC